MNVWETLFLFFAFQAALTSLFFFLKNKERYANRIFSLFLFCFAFIIFYNVLYWSEVLLTKTFIHLNQFYLVAQSLLAPLFYFYVRAVVKRSRVSLKKDIWHFIPAAYVMVAYFPYFVLSAGEKLNVTQSEGSNGLPLVTPHLGVILVGLMVLYLVYIYSIFLNRFHEDVDLKIWLRALYFSMAGCVLSYVVYYALVYASVLQVEHDYMITAAMAICIGVTTYFGFNQSEVFNGLPIEAIVPLVKYSKTGLNEEQSAELKQELLKVMERERPYLNSEIRLDELAALIGANRHQASQVINAHFQSNFFEFVNQYRIQAAVDILERSDPMPNMKELAYEVGFNNYVSFYKSFKKYTGSLPTHYKRGISLIKT
ncbi:MAG: helix-turn-helix domain-containing protein [Cyclobacteriaceae bacterium]